MRKEPDLEGVKSIAQMLLMTEVHKTPYSPVAVQHPFTSTGAVVLPAEDTEPMELLDITADKEDFATRAGLISESRRFALDESTDIHGSIGYTKENCDAFTYEENKRLSELQSTKACSMNGTA